MRKTKAIALFILMLIPTARAGNLEIAPPAGNWNKVQVLPPKAEITLKLKHGGEIKGEFLRLTETAVIVKETGIETSYLQNMIDQVLWAKPDSRAKRAAIAGGVLFGIGFGIGYAGAAKIADQNSMPAGERAAAGAVFGAVFGGAAAAISLAVRPEPRSELIYKSK